MQFASAQKAASMTALEKDYYSILRVQSTATPEQIKDAYRDLVKKYHPDARVSQEVKDSEPNVDKFRDVTEAYQVLSQRQSRINYDLSRKKNPDLYKPISERQFDMENRRDLRDRRGVTP
jgi:DnaJ-class molecular chaperone